MEITECKKKGYHTVLLSGAYKPFLREVGELLNIDTVIGSQFLYKDNCLNMISREGIISGSNKLDKLQSFFKEHKIDWENSKAYADSYHDLQLLKSVGKPVAVDPDFELEKVAKSNNWRIIHCN